MTEFSPGARPERDETPEELLAADLGLQGRRFLHLTEDRETIEIVGRVMTRRLFEAFVSPAAVASLHPEIDPENARGTALGLGLSMLSGRIDRMLDTGRAISHSDMMQVLCGTFMASREALAAMCLGLGTRLPDVLAEARNLRWSEGPFE